MYFNCDMHNVVKFTIFYGTNVSVMGKMYMYQLK